MMSQWVRDRTSDMPIEYAPLRSQHRVSCVLEFAMHQGCGVLGNAILAGWAIFSSISKCNVLNEMLLVLETACRSSTCTADG
jgi:hypothetical protein